MSAVTRLVQLTGALNAFVETQKGRVARSVGARVADNPQAQLAAAKARATLRELRLVFEDQLNEMMDYCERGERIPIDQRILWRYEASLVGQKCGEAIDELFRASGGSAIYEENPILRYFNDMHAAQAHYANNPYKPALNLGATLLGADNTDFFI